MTFSCIRQSLKYAIDVTFLNAELSAITIDVTFLNAELSAITIDVTFLNTELSAITIDVTFLNTELSASRKFAHSWLRFICQSNNYNRMITNHRIFFKHL